MNTNEPPRLDDLWNALQKQQERTARLEAELAELRAEKRALEREKRGNWRVTRAGLIKAAAAGAIGLAGADALRPQAALADTNDGELQIGTVNTTGANNNPNAATTLAAGTGMTGSAVFLADATNGGANTGNLDGLHGLGNGNKTGVTGYGGSGGGAGVAGYSGSNAASGVVGMQGTPTVPGYLAGLGGVFGASSGWSGSATNYCGVGGYASGTNGQGVAGYTDGSAGLGVFGSSGSSTGGKGVGGFASGHGGIGVAGVVSGTNGLGVWGNATDPTGIAVLATQGSQQPPTPSGVSAAVMGLTDQTSGTALYGLAPNGVGVYGASQTGFGVHAIGFPGFLAEGATVNGASGRGGRFISQQAQIRLNPAASATPPSTGQQPGDFFTASDGHLYYCQDGTNWVKVV